MSRPYPEQYAKPWRFDDGTDVLIRPIRPEDEPAIARFHATLSERSVYLRYFHMMKLDCRVAHERLERICNIDYDREIVLVVERAGEILAVGRLMKDGDSAEFAVVISDAFHGHGLGTELVHRLVEIGRAEGMKRITAEVLPENHHMLKLCKMLGFEMHHAPMEHLVKAELVFPPASGEPSSEPQSPEQGTEKA